MLGILAFSLSAAAQPAIVRPGPLSSSAPVVPGLLWIVSQHGEVLLDKGGNGAETTEPLRPSSVLGVRDELSTSNGSVELATLSGVNLRLGERSLVALLAGGGVYLASGELEVGVPSVGTASPNLPTLSLATSCGRAMVKARSARFRIEGQATLVSVYDGTVSLLSGSGVTVSSGQSARCTKGQRTASVRPLLRPPLWASTGALVLAGSFSAAQESPGTTPLRWQAVDPASRYRLEFGRSSEDREVPIGSAEVAVDAVDTAAVLDVRHWEAGSYVVRIAAIDDQGGQGGLGLPHSLLLVRVGGLGPDGKVRTEQGVMPSIRVPRGMTFSVLLDGAAPSTSGLTPGTHQLRIQVAGRSSDFPLIVSKKAAVASHDHPSHRTEFQGDSMAVWIGQTAETPEPVTKPVEPVTPNAK